MDIIRIWYIIKHRANPYQLKNAVFFNSNPEIAAIFLIFRQGG